MRITLERTGDGFHAGFNLSVGALVANATAEAVPLCFQPFPLLDHPLPSDVRIMAHLLLTTDRTGKGLAAIRTGQVFHGSLGTDLVT